ncbi:hypothetical protein AB0C27_40390 [Nonomuraea sp. NPDC048882]|uniref:hypothetical protein n=1 Tax=Nonomuraea sp. NPDC048882 TaxID=3154347 RepID=UPI0034060AA8
MRLLKKTPKTVEPQVIKRHCRPCNGVGNKEFTDYTQKPNEQGAYPVVARRCRDCNGQGWTAA